MISNYGFLGTIYMLYCTIRTKLFFSNARIIRFPIDIRTKGGMTLGRGLTTGRYCRIEVVPIKGTEGAVKKLIIGRNVQMNDHCHITASEQVEIGDNVLMASKVYISDVSHGSYGFKGYHSHPETIAAERKLITAPVKIHNNVWLGDGVCVLQGVTVGENSIIGANAVVTSDIPANSIAVGIPARVIKQFDFDRNQWVSIKHK